MTPPPPTPPIPPPPPKPPIPPPAPFSETLAAAIRERLARMGPAFLAPHVGTILSRQQPDGGFAGRLGGADLYYTRFALRALEAAGVDGDHPVWATAAAWLAPIAPNHDNLIDLFCLFDAVAVLRSRGLAIWPDDRAAMMEQDCAAALADAAAGRRPWTGGRPFGDSLYLAFLCLLCAEALGQRPFDAEAALPLVAARRCDDGGFTDTGAGAGASGQTNVTAAALAIGHILDRRDAGIEAAGARFLRAMIRPDGGLAAHGAAPHADLLSTFTGLVALRSVDALEGVGLAATARFLKGLTRSEGGFGGWPGDGETDVEYGYYGLGTLAVLLEKAGG